jgi:integrase
VNTQRGFLRRRGKTWTAYWYTETNEGRKQHTKGGFAMRKDAQVFLTEAMAALSQGSFAEPVKVRFGEYLIEQWLPLRQRALKPSTYSSYEVIIDKHVLPELGPIRIQQLTANHLDRFYGKLLAAGLSPKTVRNVHIVVRKALRDAVRKSLIPKNPAEMADPPKVSKHDIGTHRLGAAYILPAMTGLRRGEILGLRWQDVDLDEQLIHVVQTVVSVRYEIVIGTPKSVGSRRRVTIDEVTASILRRHQAAQAEEKRLTDDDYADHDLVFARVDGTPIHPDYFSQTFDRTVARLKLPKIRLHDLRHTHATIGLEVGVPMKVMSDRLGHATAAFTQDVYVGAVPVLEREAAESVARAVFSSSDHNSLTRQRRVLIGEPP